MVAQRGDLTQHRRQFAVARAADRGQLARVTLAFGLELGGQAAQSTFQRAHRGLQLAKPGDRIVVFYGSGHAFFLRQCVTEMPGFKLVEANDYLPK